MGAYTQVRGWVELDEEMISELRDLIERSPQVAEIYGLTMDAALFYRHAWVIPVHPINVTRYIFFGADIRTRALPYIRAQFEAVALIQHESAWSKKPSFPKGLVYLDEDGTYGHPRRRWNGRDRVAHSPSWGSPGRVSQRIPVAAELDPRGPRSGRLDARYRLGLGLD